MELFIQLCETIADEKNKVLSLIALPLINHGGNTRTVVECYLKIY